MIPLPVTVRHDAGCHVVTPHGDIFTDTVAPLRAAPGPLRDGGTPPIVLDLSDVDLCDSSGLNLIVFAFRTASERGGWLRLASPGAAVRRVLGITSLTRLLPVHPARRRAARTLTRLSRRGAAAAGTAPP